MTERSTGREALAARFADCWGRVVGDDADEVFSRLAQRYSEPHRHYHDLEHIRHCLMELDSARSRVGELVDAVEMALWFHDIVYEVPLLPAPENESESAALFLHWTGGRCHPSFAGQVCGMILATAHGDLPGDRGEQHVVDIDLSSLASDWDEFVANQENVRREMPAIGERDFHQGQGKFLWDHFVVRERIYSDSTFGSPDDYEHAARHNIARYRNEFVPRTYP